MVAEGRVYLSIKVSRGGSDPVWLPSFLERRIAPGHCVFYCTFAGGAFEMEASLKGSPGSNPIERWESSKPGYEISAVKRLTREQYLERLYKICPPKG